MLASNKMREKEKRFDLQKTPKPHQYGDQGLSGQRPLQEKGQVKKKKKKKGKQTRNLT
jgi:hypothetical protein